MALADYVDRAALAATQALRGVGVEEFVRRLERVPIEILFGATVVGTHEGQSALDLAVRLLARLYPIVDVRGPNGPTVENAIDLARRINPRIGTTSDAPVFSLVIGQDTAAPRGEPVFVGSDGWMAFLSTRSAQAIGASALCTGAGVSVCLGAGRIFRRLFASAPEHEDDLRLDVLGSLAPGAAFGAGLVDFGSAVLVGAGAIGESALWSLIRSPMVGSIHVVDHEPLDLSNLQRYVLADRAEVGEMKVELARRRSVGTAIGVIPHDERWQAFVAAKGTTWDRLLVALDTVEGRREVQATLPKWLGNAWTQIGDLGVSTHTFGTGPCAWCLYLPYREIPSEDQLVAEGLRLPYEEVKMQVRELLYTGGPISDDFLARIGTALHVDGAALEPFRSKPLRTLYQQGVCGGELVSIGDGATIGGEVQVPLAHQSTLTGILLGAALLIDAAGIDRPTNAVFRMDVMRAAGLIELVRPLARDSTGRCICSDTDYLERYARKYDGSRSTS
jgi:hypothetical protein